MTVTLAQLQAISDRMAADYPLHKWGHRVAVRVVVADQCTEDQRAVSFGVAHVHPTIPVVVHLAPYYVGALTEGAYPEGHPSYTPDPVDVLAECWAAARKPHYSMGKRSWWVARIAETYRAGVRQ